MKRGRAAWTKAGLNLLLSLSACELSQADVAAFQHTATGPEKLQAVVADDHRQTALRASAALSLLTLDRQDVDGQTLLLRELKQLSPKAQAEIFPAFANGVASELRTPRGRAPSQAALSAKDGAVRLLPHLTEGARASLGQRLVAWVTEDLDQRADRGRYKLEQVVAQTGPAAAKPLAQAMASTTEPSGVLRLAWAVRPDAEPSTRQLAAERLARLDHATLAATPAALGRFADRAPARTRLLAMARDSKLPANARASCLSELHGHVTQTELKSLLALAQDEESPLELRTAAVSRAGEPRSRDVLPELLKLVGEEGHAGLRQAAGELVVEIGGEDSLTSFLRRLPSAWNMTYAKSEIDAYSERINTLPKTEALTSLLGNKLYAGQWWIRVLGLRYFGVHGDKEDVWRLRQQTEEPMTITGEGFPRYHTVGREARANLELALDRLGLPR